MNPDRTVYYDDIALEVSDVVFEAMGLRSRQTLTAKQLVQFIEVESTALLSAYTVLRLTRYDVPRASRFEADVARILARLR